jgi:glycosyltransferase involved in cell wall biosynthesis
MDVFREIDLPHARFIIAGRTDFRAHSRLLKAKAGMDPRVRIDNVRVADEDIQDYFKAADILVLGRHAFSSGTAVLALDFGLPVMAVRENHVADVVPPRALIELADDSPESLRDGFLRAASADLEAARRAAAEGAEALAWPPIGRRMAEILRDNLGSDRARAGEPAVEHD